MENYYRWPKLYKPIESQIKIELKEPAMRKYYLTFTYIFTLFFLTLGHTNAQELSDEELLNMSLEDLMDVQIVNVSKVNTENLSEVPSAMTIITGEQILNSGAKNMEEVMRTVPGFDVIRTGTNSGVNYGVRGLYSTNGTNNKILFLVDNHPIQSLFYGDATVFISNFPVENIEQIEIIRGPGSALFGAGAFLGVINIRTKNPEKNVNLSATTGSFGRYGINAQFTKNITEDLNVTLSADYLTTNGANQTLNSDAAKESIDFFATSFTNYTGPSASAAPGNLNYGRTSANLNLKVDFKDFYILGSYMQSEDALPIGPYEAIVSNSFTDNRAQYIEAGYRSKTNKEAGELLLKTYANRFNYSIEGDLWSGEASSTLNHFANLFYLFDPELTGTPTLYEEGEAQMLNRSAVNNVFGGEINYAYNIQSKVNLLAGVMFERHTLGDISTMANGNLFLDRSISVGGNDYVASEAFGGMLDINEDYSWIGGNSRNIYAAFAQADFNLKNIFRIYGIEYLKLISGIRYDGYSDVGGSTNPRMALLFAPNKNVYFKGLYGEAFRAPSFVELYSMNNSLSLGNPELVPEKTSTLEVIAGYKVGKAFDVNLTYFNTSITNNIQLVADDDPETFITSIYQNVGDFRTSGLEGQIKYNFKEGGYVSGSFTSQEVLNVTTGDVFTAFDFQNQVQLSSEQTDFNPGMVPDFVINLTGNYPITKNININTSINYLDERKRSEEKTYERDENFQPTGNIVLEDNRAPIAARTIWDAAITFKNFNFAKGLSFQAAGYNLLNENNYNPTVFIRGDDMLRAGRHWGINMRFSF